MGEDAKRLLHIDRYNEPSLHYMIYQKVDDRQVRRAFGQEAAASSSSNDKGNDNDDEEEDDEEEPQSPHTTAPSIDITRLLEIHCMHINTA